MGESKKIEQERKLRIPVVGNPNTDGVDWRYNLAHHRMCVFPDGELDVGEISGQTGVLLDLRIQSSTLARANAAQMLRALADLLDAGLAETLTRDNQGS